jgi:hypothetical protein
MMKALGGILLALIGAVTCWGAYALAQSTLDFRANSISTTGTVVDLNTESSRDSDGRVRIMYRPVVEFRTETGQTVRVVAGASSNRNSYKRGEEVAVRYPASTPEAARLDTFMSNWMGALVLGIFGPITVLAGLDLLGSGIRHARMVKWLKRHGQRVSARLIGTVQNPAIQVNGKLPWRVKASWTDPRNGRAYLYFSRNYWYDPSPLLNRDSVEALINPDKPEEYLLDTGFLPKKA